MAYSFATVVVKYVSMVANWADHLTASTAVSSGTCKTQGTSRGGDNQFAVVPLGL